MSLQRWQLFSEMLLNLDIIRTLKCEFPSLALHGTDNRGSPAPIGVENEMTDNDELEPCFMCKMKVNTVIQPSTDVPLCIPCLDELDEIWSSY